MSTFGRSVIENVGRSIQVTADGKPECKAGGVTIDWSTVAAIAGSDVTWLDGLVVEVGAKALRYGQVITKITASGKYGPYDPAAGDGRQLLAIGDCFIVNESMRMDEVASDHPVAIYGGLVFFNRIIQSEAVAHTLALGPTRAEVLAAFPRLQPVNETT
jgi:uncharacterized protein (DUF433 family)